MILNWVSVSWVECVLTTVPHFAPPHSSSSALFYPAASAEGSQRGLQPVFGDSEGRDMVVRAKTVRRRACAEALDAAGAASDEAWLEEMEEQVRCDTHKSVGEPNKGATISQNE